HIINPGTGYDAECYYYAEKAKSRAFLDDFQKAKIDFDIISSTPERRNEIQTLSRSISRILTELSRSQPTREKREELQKDLEKCEDELQSTLEAVKREHPEYIGLVSVKPSRLDAVRTGLLDENTGLIQFLIGEKNLFIFYITQDRMSIHQQSEETTRTTLKLVNNYVKLLSSRHMSGQDCAGAGQRLYKRLILPGKNILSGRIQNLIIVPDRNLFYLPFETLVESRNGRDTEGLTYLMDSFEISYATSASSLLKISRRKNKGSGSMDLLAVGNPAYPNKNSGNRETVQWKNITHEYYLENQFDICPLPNAQKEIKSIAGMLQNGKHYTISGLEATEEAVKSLDLTDFKIIHFATHSLLDEKVANRSALVLTLDDDPTEDGFLQVREIYNQKLRADLVVLSACQTARGKLEKGEGIQ
ncbi:MAG: CHAT domain-containing protein, partial [Candidatus Aminicenantes bacterium]|nr:CHAT domain-containing protein [Candidatus Aminicenantes bacterium]